MNEYFHGSVRQHIERGQILLSRIPVDLPREFHLLAQYCTKELDRIMDGLRALISQPRMDQLDKQPERLRLFQQLVTRLNKLETVGIAALERHNETDLMLNQLIELIRTEISYPILPPVVSSLSQQYFHIYPDLNLLFVPLCEANFLLHLPDLYHEIAHPLLVTKYNLRVKPFQDAILKSLDLVLSYIKKEQQKEDRRRGPEQIGYYLRVWGKSWWKWVIEFFCDLFAVYTVGPAYAWAHFHLCAKLCENPYEVPTMTATSHPADDARMRVILYGLQRTGFEKEKESIHQRWQEFVAISGAKRQSEYDRCYPEYLFESLARHAYDGVTGMGCRIASPETNDLVYAILNEAWIEFWKTPEGYAKWERMAIANLHNLCSK